MKFLTVCLIMGGLSLNGAGVEPDDSDRALAGAAVHPGDGAGVSGSELVLAEGGASGNPVPTGTIQWYLDGVALIGENGLTIDKGQHGVGVYRATVIWANGVIPAATGLGSALLF